MAGVALLALACSSRSSQTLKEVERDGGAAANGGGSAGDDGSGGGNTTGGKGGGGTAGGKGGATGGSGDGGASDGGANDGGANDGGGGAGGACVGSLEDPFTVPACGETPGTTSLEYRGDVVITVSGVAVGAGPSGHSDAFYSVEALNHAISIGACPDCFRFNRIIDSGAECAGESTLVNDLLVDPYPDYNPLHIYTVRLALGENAPDRLAFSIPDCGCFDNSGSFELAIEVPCEP